MLSLQEQLMKNGISFPRHYNDELASFLELTITKDLPIRLILYSLTCYFGICHISSMRFFSLSAKEKHQ